MIVPFLLRIQRSQPQSLELIVDVDLATVNLARSKEGLTNWEASLENPIVAPEPELDSWNL